ncbi:MAG: hypothetical protein EA359_02005 [Balneolaceae bacterium]|nr:MAG: hypothetical protein EA359_02005 [Balneolaceae bacterium]
MISRANKFVILSQSRSGSTLLKELLGSHPSIQCEGEILALTDGYLSNRFTLKAWQRLPILYFYCRKFQSKREVYGFTLFIYHTPYIKGSIETLSKMGWKIIHLKRKNIINQVISNIIARRNWYFHNFNNIDRTADNSFDISEDEFLKAIRIRINWHQKEKSILHNVEHLQVIYEDDLEDNNKWQDTVDKIFNYLKIESMPVNSGLHKTYTKSYSELVCNYRDLIACLDHHNLSEKLREIT